MIGLLIWLALALSGKLLPPEWPKEVFVLTGVLLLFLPTLLDAHLGASWLRHTQLVALQEPAVFQGMLVPEVEADYYHDILLRLHTYFSVYPTKTFLNLTPDALWGAVDPHYYQISRMFVYWDWAIPIVDPAYGGKVRAYIQQHRPLLLVRDPVVFPAYCSINLKGRDADKIVMYSRDFLVHVPSEDVFTISQTIQGKQLTSLFDDLEVRASTTSGVLDIIPKGKTKLLPHTLSQHFVITSKLFGDCPADLSSH
jgi:hypothetical protein